MKSEWNFDETIRGTVKGVPVELDLDEMSDDEDWVQSDAMREWGTARGHHGSLSTLSNLVSKCGDCADDSRRSLTYPV